VEWNECDSDEPPGWYYAIVKGYDSECKALIEYADSSTESINLHSVKWLLTRKGQKHYLPLDKPPGKFPLKKLRAECEKPKFYLSSAHTTKAYADDISIISSNTQDHKACLDEFSSKAADLDFILKPEKCASILFDGLRIDKKSTIPIYSSHTQNIATSPWKILGHLISPSLTKQKKVSKKKLESKLLSLLKAIDQRPIRGEYKSWILKHYVAPSLYFLMMVDSFSESFIQNMQKQITKHLKRWLNIPRSATLATLFHPQVLKFPYLPHIRECAQLSMLSAIEHSSDSLINELTCLLTDPEFRKRQHIPPASYDALQVARSSIDTINFSTMKAKSIVKSVHAEYWSDTLNHLQVQSKFKDIITL
jgi:hypothetical protein